MSCKKELEESERGVRLAEEELRQANKRFEKFNKEDSWWITPAIWVAMIGAIGAIVVALINQWRPGRRGTSRASSSSNTTIVNVTNRSTSIQSASVDQRHISSHDKFVQNRGESREPVK